MKYILGVLVLSVMLIACQSKTTQSSDEQSALVYEKLDASTFRSTLLADEGEKIILDVRTPAEFNAGAVPESINIDFLADGFEESVESLDKDKTVYIYCQGGVRSSKAAKVLQKKGFQHIIELEKGFGSY